MNIVKKDTTLHASAKAVIINYLQLPGKGRIEHILKRTSAISEEAVEENLGEVMREFQGRHRNIETVFTENFEKVEKDNGDIVASFSENRKLLTGSFFTKEYSIQAAALFNPSIISHPEQNGLKGGEQRFIITLRATGEGHISSIIFKTGVADAHGDIKLDADTGYYTCITKNNEAKYTKAFILKCTATFSSFDVRIADVLPDTFTAGEAHELLQELDRKDAAAIESIATIKSILDSNYELKPSAEIAFNEKVIFPNAAAESMGMEDVRMVKFSDGGNTAYYGTYTAYNGKQIKTQLLETNDFNVFKIRTLYGSAVSDKGMALFPEKVNGKYVMITRQGGETINIMYADDLYKWDTYVVLMQPLYLWEMVQLGNCGSPIKTDRGWLLLTHGVGAIRTYVISAILLDLKDPSRIIGRLKEPLIKADEMEREGYVPNVVYTCGLLKHGELLIIPYAVSDSATRFATIKLNDLLDEMLLKN
jgi:predicted GH43/DUF377 family glycosyl hydrolase